MLLSKILVLDKLRRATTNGLFFCSFPPLIIKQCDLLCRDCLSVKSLIFQNLIPLKDDDVWWLVESMGDQLIASGPLPLRTGCEWNEKKKGEIFVWNPGGEK
ncbi:hypothetical protein NPIL_698861 [Nephila pilipes]|uniref:Uncharacterized protein n=1 Tax=Nephila pilipes TaxID=299642 RepID=A0A8X6U5K9_NEPPI|nr:hypothetical protein NPIL_698861 [Nephila pilipes]